MAYAKCAVLEVKYYNVANEKHKSRVERDWEDSRRKFIWRKFKELENGTFPIGFED